MTDFHRRQRMEPSRSLPMSALNQRDRSTPTKRAGRAAHEEPHSPPRTPNPYTSRAAVKMTRRTPARAKSTSREGVIMANVMGVMDNNSNDNNHGERSSSPPRNGVMNRERSSSPSKHHTAAINNNKDNDLCLSSPAACLIPTNKRRRQYGIAKAFLKALTLIVLGFGCGVIYNIWNNTTVKAHIDLESIPSVLLTDELVKKLAQDNQLQTTEIEKLKQQVEDARKQAHLREQDQGHVTDSSINSPNDLPDVVAVGGNELLHHKKDKTQGGLRAVKRLIWDENGNVQELNINQGESVATFPQSHSRDKHNDNASEQQQQDHPHEDHEVNRDNFDEEHEAQQEYQQQEQQGDSHQQQEQPLKHDQSQHDGHIYVPEHAHSVTEHEFQERYHHEHPQEAKARRKRKD